MRRLALLLVFSVGCASPWGLRAKTGTAFNLYDSARYDEKRLCEAPTSQKPGWCAPCQYALNRLLDAVELAQSAGKRPGSAPWQKKRLASTRAAVEKACPQQ